MARLIPLPGGQSATLRAPEDVSERLRRPIVRAMRGIRPEIVDSQQEVIDLPDEADGTPGAEKRARLQQLQFAMTNAEADAYQDAGDYAAVALIEQWSFPQPVTLDGLLDLPGRTLDILRREIGPHVRRLFVDAGPDPNPPAPSGGSNGFAPHSEEARLTASLTSGGTTGSSSSG